MEQLKPQPSWKEVRQQTDDEIARRLAIQQKEIALANKPDSGVNLSCFISEFPLAMAAIAKIHNYQRGPLVKADYLPSLLRHLFGIGIHPDHDAAVVWNALARLELRERNKKDNLP